MKKIDFKIIIIGLLLLLCGFLFFNPKIEVKEVPYEVVKTEIIKDTILVDKIIEKKIYVPKYITQIEKDTIEVVREVYIDKPVPITKKVYVDKVVDRLVEVPVNEKKLFLGFGYQYDFENYFSGANIKLIHKTPKDKMFSLDVGFRNDLLDKETNVGRLRPYIGGSIYFRIDNPNK